MFLAPVRHRIPLLRRPPKFRFRYSSSSSTKSNDAKKPYYITTPIFYPNAAPHIGHLYTLVLGDIFARYRRLVEPEREVKFLVGTDEHGLKIQQAAAKAAGREDNVDVRAFCDELSEVFQNLSKKANISYTTFARTTGEGHALAVAHVWRVLYEKGYIYKGDYEGWYSITDECFYTTTQVTQSSQDADVWVSKETGSRVEWTKEHNYMFRLSAFREALALHYSTSSPASSDKSLSTVYPPQYNSDVLQALEPPSPHTPTPSSSPGQKEATHQQPLADISISRPRSRLTWGIPVPGDADHTVYVWFDALLIYLSGVGYPGRKDGGWPADLQIIGKDILKFHAIYLPAILLALSGPAYPQLGSTSLSSLLQGSAGLGLPKHLLTHAHWTVEQAKMSKSVGNVVDPVVSMDEYGVDVVRFYLARVGGRFRDDVDWSTEQLEKHAKELQSLLANYLLRIASPKIAKAAMVGRETNDGTRERLVRHPLNAELVRAVVGLPSRVRTRMEGMEVAEGVVEVLEVLKLANKVLTEIAPWSPKTCDALTTYETRQTAILTLRVAAICLSPFVPRTSETVLDALLGEGEGIRERTWASVLGMECLEREGGLVEGPEEMWVQREVRGVRLF